LDSGTTNSGVRPEPHLKSLTAARFIAAIWVVIYHFSPPASSSTPLLVRNFTNLGFIGVGFFFVLSGFVLTYIYAPRVGRFKPASFFQARFARIYPVYFLSFLLAVSAVIANSLHGQAFLSDPQVKLPAYVLMVQSWLPWYGQELNGTAWTLSVEVLFYAMFPLLLPLVVRANRRTALAGLFVTAILGLIVPIIAVRMGLTPASSGFEGNLFRYFPLIHLPTFVFGALLARVYEEDRSRDRYAKWALPAGIAMIALVVAFNRTWFFYFLHDGALLIPFGLIIYGMAGREGISGRSNVPKWLILLGDASYGIYILQFPVFQWTKAVLIRLPLHLDLSGQTNGTAMVAYACFLSGVCVLIYRYFELPAREAIRVFGHRRRTSQRDLTEQTPSIT
jgi:peptidoglycan/LPS O-acetylase OafA/YrhL